MSSRPIFMRRRRIRTEQHRHTNLPQFILGFFGLSFFGMIGVVVAAIVLAVGLALSSYNSIAAQMDVGAFTKGTAEQFKTTRIYDRTGQVVLYELIDPQGGDRTVVPLDKIPKNTINATIALEDKTFWTNQGVDLLGLGRAMLNMLQNKPLQGASTLTQQLVKKVLLPEREGESRTSIDLKLKEMIWARELTSHYSKQQILEWYFNTIYYGNFAYGIEAASEAYFGKHASELTLSEAATLAAVPEYPALNPIDNPDYAETRRNITLDRMVVEGYITDKQAEQAKKQKIEVVQKQFDIKAPHFVFYVRKYLEENYSPEVLRAGLKVYTTLDYNIQQTAEEVARNQVAKLTQEKRNVTNASVVVMRPTTGEILGMVGSVDYFNRAIDGQVNIATSSRQPGSSFKMFSYLTAFVRGDQAGHPISPGTVVYDVRTPFEDPPNPPYVPENYDRKYHGPVSLRTALGSSFNIPAVKVLDLVGVRNTLDMAHKLGITTLNAEHYGLALTLGGGEVTLLDMTYAYSVIANNGIMAGKSVDPRDQKEGYRKLNPVAILKIVDASGKTLEEYTKPAQEQIVTPQQAFLITSVLSDNNARAPGFGVNSVLKLTRPAAVKTGTTSSWKDNWTIGYTPDFTIGVWVGNANNAEMEHISGITGAAPIWHDIMERIHANLPVHQFIEPPGMVRVAVCTTSGLLPTPECPTTSKEIFIKGNEPKEKDNIWHAFRIFTPNGKLATPFDPPDQVETKVFPSYPSEAQDWVRDSNQPQAPTEMDTTYAASTAGGDLAILSPAPYAYVKSPVTVVGNAKIGDLRDWTLSVGAGMDPKEWQPIGNGSGPVDNGSLATWETGDNGLFTLQLTANDNGGGTHTSTAQITVDNKAPTVSLINPWDDKQYLMEDDEWVSIDADARDNLSMGKVDFYLDGKVIGTSTVAPFTYKWNITMRDALSRTLQTAATIPLEIATTDDQGQTITNTVEAPVQRKAGRSTVTFPNGFSAIRDAGYSEVHTVKVKAYDAAGNAVESKAVRFVVAHRPPKTTPTPPPAAFLPPTLGDPSEFWASIVSKIEWWKRDTTLFLAYN